MAIRKTATGTLYNVVDYDVSKCPVSFCHPLHWLIGQFLQYPRFFDDSTANQYGFKGIRELIFSFVSPGYDGLLFPDNNNNVTPPRYRYELDDVDYKDAKLKLLRIMDYPIRTCVFMSQIRAGFWKHNGKKMVAQVNSYLKPMMREDTYDQDIAFIQLYVLHLGRY